MGYTIDGKHVLITGGSSGIGAGLAAGFAHAGATVGICARRTDRLAAVAEAIRDDGGTVHTWTVDLADLDAIERFAAQAAAELGGVDVLVNNAGIPKRRAVTALTPEVVEAVMALNYSSPVRLTLALLPQLIERRGRVVNVSSVAARLGPPAEAAYSASKAALTAFSESMRVDLAVAGHDVGVHVVNPGVIDTDLFHLPDNDESIADIEALPVEAMVEPVLAQLETGVFEIYVPDWFSAVVEAKFRDTTAFLDGSIAWARQRHEAGV